jgi:hypothetical protein
MNADLLSDVPPVTRGPIDGLTLREIFTTDDRGIRQVDVMLEKVVGAEHISRGPAYSYQRGELTAGGIRKSPWRVKRLAQGDRMWRVLHDPPPITEAARFYLGVE